MPITIVLIVWNLLLSILTLFIIRYHYFILLPEFHGMRPSKLLFCTKANFLEKKLSIGDFLLFIMTLLTLGVKPTWASCCSSILFFPQITGAHVVAVITLQ